MHVLRRSLAISCWTPLLVGRAERVFLGRRHPAGLLLDLFHHVDQHLGGAQIGARRLVDHLLDDRLTLGDLAALAVDGDVDLLVQGGDQERRQALPARAARVAGLTLLERPAPRRLAIADLVISLGLGHVAFHISWNACGPPVAEAERASYLH